MSEGEFKKRICGFLERTVLDTPTAKKAMIEVVSEVFDEARKEFPRYGDFKDIVFQDNLSAEFHYILVVTQWFLKYLGNK